MVDAYECDKIILDTYGDIITLKRRRDDADKDEEPSDGSDRGSKRREGKEPESTSAPKDKASKTTGKSTEESKSHQKTASESAPAEEPLQATKDLEEPSHQEFETGVTDDQPIAEASQHPEWFQKQTKPLTPDQFLMNQLKVDNLTPKLLAGLTYKLMKGSCKSLVELKFFLEEVYKATIDQLDWNNPEEQQYPHNLLKPLPLIPNSLGRRVILLIISSTMTSSIYVAVPPVVSKATKRSSTSQSRICTVPISSARKLTPLTPMVTPPFLHIAVEANLGKREQIVKKKTDSILALQSELASPKIKGSLNADEDIGVDEVSSAIDGVFDMSNVESMEVRSKLGEFSNNKKSLEEIVGGGEALGDGEDDDSGNATTDGGDDTAESGDISILNSLTGHGSLRSPQLCGTISTTDFQVLIDKGVDKEV
nr:hypothetical protein [Tanacetum cinerariifolium]